MKQISPVLFLAVASWMTSNTPLLGQSNNADLAAHGPITNLLQEIDLLPSNPLPGEASQSTGSTTKRSASSSSSPVADLGRPKQPPKKSAIVAAPSSGAIDRVPPNMPNEYWTAPRTPKPKSTSTVVSPPESEWPSDTADDEIKEFSSGCDASSYNATATYQSGAPCGAVVAVEDGACHDECEVEQATGHQKPESNRRDQDSERSRRRKKSHKESGFFARHKAKKSERNDDDDQPRKRATGFEDCEQSYPINQAADCDYDETVFAPINSQQKRRRGNDGNTGVNTIIGVSALYFTKNYDDPHQLSRNTFIGNPGLSTNDADHDYFRGLDANLIRRRDNGKGMELRYFGLTPGNANVTLIGGSPYTTLNGPVGGPSYQLSEIGMPGEITSEQAFNLADVHQISRMTSIHSAELNFLRMGRNAQTGRYKNINCEYLAGFRYLKFDESLYYSAQSFRPNALPGGDLMRADYLTDVSNDLYGVQIGGRTEIAFLNKFSLIIGTKAGIFNNQYTNRQHVRYVRSDGSRVYPQVLNGADQGAEFNTQGEDSDISMLGELDLGLTYQLFERSRIRVGYRALFVTEVAAAGDQIEARFDNIQAVSQPESNDELILHGGYFGMEFAF